MQVVLLLYPRLTQIDLAGPYDVLARFEELTLHLVWKNLDLVTDSGGLRLLPARAFADCPQADILFVPGGPGQISLMEDKEVLSFFASAGERRPLCDLGLHRISCSGCRRASHRLSSHLPLAFAR